jgi:protein SCO1
MEFNVRDTNELAGLTVGDTVTFRLTATEETHWIDQIRRIRGKTIGSGDQPVRTNAVKTVELKPGDALPDCELLAEDGRTARFSDFRGRALAFTFFFTRCPLPDYCPRMNGNFGKARDLAASASGGVTNWQFLSISFDPEFDRPDVLTRYANFYRSGSADRWLFCSASTNSLAVLAPRLDLMVRREGGSISHNLRTVVVDPRGRIYRQFDGNEWTPAQLVEALVEAARVGQRP